MPAPSSPVITTARGPRSPRSSAASAAPNASTSRSRPTISPGSLTTAGARRGTPPAESASRTSSTPEGRLAGSSAVRRPARRRRAAGGAPERSGNRASSVRPTAKRSERALGGAPRRSSGAKYRAVPERSPASARIRRAALRSMSTPAPSSRTRTFSGLKSPWTMPAP
ncbi:hypothetical protein WMF36_07680 [Sorangium sp. So ce887]